MPPNAIELSLSSLLPTLSPLPADLIQLSASLLAQSRARAASLKPDEEIARTYACCHIACERLGRKLGLELSTPAPPAKPSVYQKLKAFLSSALRTPVTPRARRVEDRLAATSRPATPASGRSGRAALAGGARDGGGEGGGGSGRRSGRLETPSERGPVATPVSTRKRKAETKPPELSGASARDESNEEPPQTEVAVVTEEDNVRPTKKPANTPLRRREKHAGRGGHDDASLDVVGAAGLLPGLGTMFQPAVDWLSDERRADYAAWKRGMMREIARIEAHQA